MNHGRTLQLGWLVAATLAACGGRGDAASKPTKGDAGTYPCAPGLHDPEDCPPTDPLEDVLVIARGAVAHFDAAGELCPEPPLVPLFQPPVDEVWVPGNVDGPPGHCREFGCEGWRCVGFAHDEPILGWHGYQLDAALPWYFGVSPPGERFAFDAWVWAGGAAGATSAEPIVYVRANFDATGKQLVLDEPKTFTPNLH